MLIGLIVANIVTFALLLLSVRRLLRLRSLARQRNFFSRWPIPTIRVEQLDPRFQAGPVGMGPATQIISISEYWVASTSDFEAWILCNMAKTAQKIFEFGTATGRTTYLMAVNSGENCHITTITLAPDQAGSIDFAAGDDRHAREWAQRESSYQTFLYQQTPVEQKVEQLFGDSKAFDETPYVGQMDLVFVDGAHTESYVLSDSAKALRMVAPGGMIVWHDYRGPHKAKGVYAALNSLSRQINMVHVRGTSFVVYRHPKNS